MKYILVNLIFCALLAAGEKSIQRKSVPPAVQMAIQPRAGKSTIKLVEAVTDDQGKVTYEAHIKKGIRTSEYKFAPDGSAVK